MFSLILTAAAAAAMPAPAASPVPAPLPVAAAPMPTVATARMRGAALPVSRWTTSADRALVHRAMNAPAASYDAAKGPRYCFLDDVTHRGETRRVCRTRPDWNRLGLDPVL